MQSNVLHDVGIPEVSLVCPVVIEPLTCLLLEIGIAESRNVNLFQLLSKHNGSNDFFELLYCSRSLELTVSAWQERFKLIFKFLERVLGRPRLCLQIRLLEAESLIHLEQVVYKALQDSNLLL